MKKLALYGIILITFIQALHAQGWEKRHPRVSINERNIYSFPLPGGYWGIRRLEGYNTAGVTQLGVYRTDLEGNQLWLSIIPFDSIRQPRVGSAIITSDQNMLITGSYSKTSSNAFKYLYVAKINPSGNVIWYKEFFNPDNNHHSTGVVELSDHTLRLAVNKNETVTGYQKNELWALDSTGNQIWIQEILPVISSGKTLEGLSLSPNGALYSLIIGHSNTYYAVKMDNLGEVIWTSVITSGGFFKYYNPYSTSDNGLAFLELGFNSDSLNYSIYKFDIDGNQVWKTQISSVESLGGPTTWDYLSMGADGSFLATLGSITSASTGVSLNRTIARVLPDGSIAWNRYAVYTDRIYYFGSANSTSDGGFILGGSLELVQYQGIPVLIKMDSLGNIHTNAITGTVRKDLNLDCLATVNEPPLSRFTLRLTKPGADTTYTLSNTAGNYLIDADTGTYQLAILTPNNYWLPCDSFQTVTFTGTYDTVAIAQPIQAVVDCPLPEVDICTPFLRRCDTSQYFVRYSNTGTVASDSLTVQIVLDPYLGFISAQFPPTAISGDTLVWQRGPLPISGSSTFWIKVLVDCDSTVLGQTHCTEAHIFPDTLCDPNPAVWSGASIVVSVTCEGDSLVRTRVRNESDVPTSQTVDFIVIEDDVILFQGNQPFAPFEEVVQTYPADGSFFRVEATQEPNYPIPDMPSAFVEGCGGFDSLGYPQFFSQNVSSPFEDIDCTQNVDSYDPNDKQAFPRGIKAEHFIHQNEDIEYLIRFQNEGTALAKVVTIRDTLSNLLEVSSLKPGAGSHLYTYELIGPGVLQFKFSNINLPPKTINEALSQGFVSFRIRQKKDNPIGAVIHNSAAIYFDYNAPVITNQTWHTIGQDYLPVALKDLVRLSKGVRVEPNPVQTAATLQLEHAPGQQFLFELYTSSGGLIRQQGFTGSQYHFTRGNLPAGTYFFRISGAKSWQRGGKLVLETLR